MAVAPIYTITAVERRGREEQRPRLGFYEQQGVVVQGRGW